MTTTETARPAATPRRRGGLTIALAVLSAVLMVVAVTLLAALLTVSGQANTATDQRDQARHELNLARQDLARAESDRSDCADAFDESNAVATEYRSLLQELSQRTSTFLGNLLTNPAPIDIDDLTLRAMTARDQQDAIDLTACG